MAPTLVTTAQIAKQLQVRQQTVLAWVRAGRIPAIRLNRKVIRFNAQAVARAMGVEVSA